MSDANCSIVNREPAAAPGFAAPPATENGSGVELEREGPSPGRPIVELRSIFFAAGAGPGAAAGGAPEGGVALTGTGGAGDDEPDAPMGVGAVLAGDEGEPGAALPGC